MHGRRKTKQEKNKSQTTSKLLAPSLARPACPRVALCSIPLFLSADRQILAWDGQRQGFYPALPARGMLHWLVALALRFWLARSPRHHPLLSPVFFSCSINQPNSSNLLHQIHQEIPSVPTPVSLINKRKSVTASVTTTHHNIS